MGEPAISAPRLNELVPLRELQPKLRHIFPTQGSLDWAYRMHRAAFIGAGAVYELGGRLFAHPYNFERTALEIGNQTLAMRHGVRQLKPPPV